MKRLATAIATVALIATPAFAADVAVKAPPPTPAAVYNWTGWYAGVNAGASFGNVKTDFNVAPYTFTSSPVFVTFPGVAVSDRNISERIHGRWSDRLQLAALANLGRGV
jgi:opacity protein-like surface antigen